ncbi:MAG: hypothetical protein ACON4T_01595 [Synechococcus sp.]
MTTAIAVPACGAQWDPPTEPDHWTTIRDSIQSQGLISPADWIFFGALDSETTQAAEYLSNLRSDQNAVVFDGLLLLKRDPKAEWAIRPLMMRALCKEARLERRNPEGQWTDYSGRPDTARKVEWICRQKLNANRYGDG